MTSLQHRRINIPKLHVLTAIVFLSLAASAVAQVANPGFEDPITSDGPPFVGSWEGFSGGGATAANSTVFPRTGSQSLRLDINSTPNTFAGAFQDIPVSPLTPYSFNGWHATTNTTLDVGVEFRIEWRNSGSNTEISRTPNSTTAPGLAYSEFSLPTTSPAGADIARIVYAIQSFSTAPLGNGTVFVDDITFVPEPSAIALLSLGGLGGLALIAIRRRRA